MQIKKKLPLIMISLICVPLLILAIVIYLYSANNLITRSENNIKQLATSEGRALEALIKAKEYRVQVLATDERIIDALNEKESNATRMSSLKVEKAKELLKQVCTNEDIYEAFLIDKEGNIFIASNEESEQITLKDQEMYKNVLKGETVLSDILFSNTESGKVINITVPVKNEYDEVIGAVCQVIFNNWFSDFSKNIKIEQTGYAYILDEKLNFIAHPDIIKEGEALVSDGMRQMIKEAYDKEENHGAGVYTYKGQEKYGSFYIVGDIDWIICVVQNVKEIEKQAVIEFLLIIMSIIVLVIIVSIASMQISKKITRPIDQLTTIISHASDGDFSQICSYAGNDELGVLSKHYNQMLKSLGESHSDLNHVCEELSATQAELKNNIEELTRSKEALLISEKRYKTTLNAIEEVIWEYNVKTKTFFATEKWEELVGYSSNNIKIFNVIKDTLEPHHIEVFMLVLKGCIEGRTDSFSQELYMKNEHRWLLCKGHVVRSENGKLDKLIGILTDITDNKANEERVRKLAFFDVLTGCLNKQTFMESLETWLSPGEAIKDAALLFIDLDDFKKINDTLGHEMGDKLLNYVAKVLRHIIPQDSFISRFGGDEFVIFKTSVSDLGEIQEMVYSILNIFQDPIRIDGKDIHITCSVGIALYPLDGTSGDILLKNADTAMYKAKDNGKNSYSFYAPDMSKSLDRKLLVEGALREAIGKNTLYLQYQPIIELKTGKTVAAEALLRLKDDELGFISPGEFIPIAEETGLIIPTGDWVIENALRELSYYRLVGYESLSITINVSSLQMKDRNFIDKLKLMVQNAKIPPEFIKLEVTESVFMENVEKSINLFREIKKMGIKLALDDFGTGYSSLNYLRSIPLDILKIDKSFIDEITTSRVLSEIVDSIIGMAHTLDILVVAEGVESEEQLSILKEKGCDFIQGYFFSKPLMPNQLEERLQEEKYA